MATPPRENVRRAARAAAAARKPEVDRVKRNGTHAEARASGAAALNEACDEVKRAAPRSLAFLRKRAALPAGTGTPADVTRADAASDTMIKGEIEAELIALKAMDRPATPSLPVQPAPSGSA